MGSGLLEDFNGEVPVPRWEVWAVGPPAFGFVVVGDADGEHGDRGLLTYRGRCADRGPRAGALVSDREPAVTGAQVDATSAMASCRDQHNDQEENA